MAKYVGKVGYYVSTFDGVDKYTDEIIEKTVRGDMLQDHSRWKNADKINDDIDVNNRISIVADPFALNNFHSIKYATYMQTKWKVTSVEVAYPRLILTLGGVYNG